MPKKKKSKPKPLPENMEEEILNNKENRKKIKVKIFETPPAPPPQARKKSGY